MLVITPTKAENRSENGIKVILYCTMIAAILLLAYKQINGLKGYKIMKQRFVNDLEKSLMKNIVAKITPSLSSHPAPP